MTRINLVLLLLLLASSLYLVKTSYESRRLFAAIDRAKVEERQLEIEFKRLDAERQAQGTNARVEKVARDKLQMRTATPGVTHYVVDVAAPGASN
jgi:cell division protein FtsL